MYDVEGIRQEYGRGRAANWDYAKDDMESLGLSQEDAQIRNKWRKIEEATG